MPEARSYEQLVREMIDRIRLGSLTEKRLVEAMKGDPDIMMALLMDLASKGVVSLDTQAKALIVHEGKAARFLERWE